MELPFIDSLRLITVLSIETLTGKQIRAARNRDIPHVRERIVAT